MVTLQLLDKKITEHATPCSVFLVEDNFSLTPEMKACEKHFSVSFDPYFKAARFTGSLMQVCTIPVLVKNKLSTIIFVGMGAPRKKQKTLSVEQYRRALAQAYRTVAAKKQETCAIAIPAAKMFGIDSYELGKETAIILNMAAYHFDEFITDQDRKETVVYEITCAINGNNKKEMQKGVDDGQVIAQSVNTARHWIDLPGLHLYPQELADKARDIAKKNGLAITVFGEKQIIEMGMGGIAAVSRGSDRDCQLVIMEYKAPKKNAPTLAFVGKGITFDTGGISLKPAASMEKMKDDMSGAAAVITVMQAIAHLKPDVNVIALAPMAENMPSGTATRPGDIIRFYNGKTAEVKNTDAEGRLILADALSYAVKQYKPDAIIDVATLTGACAHALGPFFTGLMSQDEELVETIEDAADRTGDRVWRLPLDDDYKKAIRSDVADICNIGNPKYMAGAITAGHFLKHFVSDTPWAHLDIAGTAFDVPDIPYYRPGATGAAIRLLIDVAMTWQ